MITDLAPGSMITTNSHNPEYQYVISKINIGYIQAIHANDNVALNIFPENELLSGQWLVKEIQTALK